MLISGLARVVRRSGLAKVVRRYLFDPEREPAKSIITNELVLFLSWGWWWCACRLLLLSCCSLFDGWCCC